MINNVSLDGRRLRVEKAKVNRTLFIAKMNRSITNLVLATLLTRTVRTTRANRENVAWRGVVRVIRNCERRWRAMAPWRA
jgi:hypothetical protein